jgi:hypothetical protein
MLLYISISYSSYSSQKPSTFDVVFFSLLAFEFSCDSYLLRVAPVTARTKCKSNPLCRLQLFEDTKLKKEEREARGKEGRAVALKASSV